MSNERSTDRLLEQIAERLERMEGKIDDLNERQSDRITGLTVDLEKVKGDVASNFEMLSAAIEIQKIRYGIFSFLGGTIAGLLHPAEFAKAIFNRPMGH